MTDSRAPYTAICYFTGNYYHRGLIWKHEYTGWWNVIRIFADNSEKKNKKKEKKMLFHEWTPAGYPLLEFFTFKMF
jgi:hypothetical protein